VPEAVWKGTSIKAVAASVCPDDENFGAQDPITQWAAQELLEARRP
jgi:hypothetical protein